MGKINTIKALVFSFCVLLLGGFSGQAFAQGTHEVSGTVTSAADGETLPGVNITVQGTNIGTSTDADGQYSLDVPSAEGTLVFSFVGFQTQEVPIEGRSTINVELASQTFEGEELVVVGYGQQEAQDVTGSVSSVSSDQLNEVPVSDAASALQGRAAGVLVSNTADGTPGSTANHSHSWTPFTFGR
ncbi:MAG: carboxypeptidase-like regulatory domain-containing protein [Balneolaceae bacterium]|nr:carboxypeptidase-like regulatory domain-containing protein [Balneolaceae bacterium]